MICPVDETENIPSVSPPGEQDRGKNAVPVYIIQLYLVVRPQFLISGEFESQIRYYYSQVHYDYGLYN